LAANKVGPTALPDNGPPRTGAEKSKDVTLLTYLIDTNGSLFPAVRWSTMVVVSDVSAYETARMN